MKNKTFNIIANIISIESIICGIIMYFIKSEIDKIMNVDIKTLSIFCIIYGLAIALFVNIYKFTEINEKEINKEKQKWQKK